MTAKELDGKTVEFETHGRGTAYGKLWVRTLADRALDIRIQILAAAGSDMAGPVSLDAGFLQRHPKPQRAEFLWAEHATEILRYM